MKDRVYQDWVSELKSKSDIVSVISSYIPLTKKGINYWGCCPFHHEKTPSFAVNSDGQFYHCFGCGVSGDVISFVSEFENVDFLEACKILAEKCGYVIPEFKHNPEYKKFVSDKEQVLNILRDTAKYYYKNLMTSPNAEPARIYLKQRKISEQLIKRFGLGYSLGYNELIDYLRLKGYSQSLILKSGVAGKKNDRIYDALANRLIIPVINAGGDIIAFGGRILEKNNTFAKYKNTTQTIVFDKSKNLYAINLVKRLKQKEGIKDIIMVEGYMDVISLNKAGYQNVVASMGTSLTKGQAVLLKRFTDKIFVAYDGDTAGQKATLRSLDILREEGLEVKVIKLPDGLDPDDTINKLGKEYFIKLKVDAVPLIDYKLEKIEAKYDLVNAESRGKYAIEAVQMLNELKEPAIKEAYLDIVSKKARITKTTLLSQLNLSKDNKTAINIPVSTIESAEKNNNYYKAVRFVLNGMLTNKEYANYEDINECLCINEHKKIFEYIKKCYDNNQKPIAGNLYDIMEESEELNKVINYSYNTEELKNSKKYFDDSLKTLKQYYLKEKRKNLLEKLHNAVDINERNEIVKQITKIQTNLKK